MIVEQVDAFKTWLTAVLKPMCDADPAALAKYVLALIKKDKTGEELHKMMVDQLEVFLENETESFVSLVLRTLETQDYITTPVIPNANPPNPLVVKKDTKPVLPPVEIPPLVEGAVNGRGEAAKRERKPDDKRIRHRSTSRNRSRSRSWDRSKRSKSRDRDTHRDKRDRPRAWRNKSPPTSASRRFSRRSRTPSPNRGRSPHRPRYRNRSPASRSRSRSRSRTPDKRNKERLVDSRPTTPVQDPNANTLTLNSSSSGGSQSVRSVVVQSGNTGKTRCRDFDEQGYCMRGEMCPYDHGVDPVVLEDSALSSVLTYNPNAGAPGEVPPIGAALQGHPLMGPRGIGSEYNPQAPQMYHRGGFRGPRGPPMGLPRGPMMGSFPNQSNLQRELIPVPVMDQKSGANDYPVGGGGGPPGLMSGPYRFQSNYAGNVGSGDGVNTNPQQMPPMPPSHLHHHNHHHHNNAYKKKPFDFARLGPRTGGGKNPANCSLELKKVPQGLNTITHLNNHFSKFGKPVNIQVNYEGDPEAAIVTFSSHAEANAAYRSTEAVLNNRFIKVFWHNGSVIDGKHQENVPPAGRSSVKDRLGLLPTTFNNNNNVKIPSNTNKVLNLVQPRADNNNGANESDDKNTINNNNNKEEMKAAIQKNQDLLAAKEKLKKNQDEQRKEVLKIKQDLRKRKQDLLEKQLTQQKILIEKTKKLPAGPQRDLIVDTIKKTQESIEAIKKDLLQSVTAAKVTTPLKRAKEDVQREMLDAELDLITKQQEGADTSEIQKKLYELRAKAAMTRNRGGGGGGRPITRRFHPFQRHLLSKNNLIAGGDQNKNKPTVGAVNFQQKHNVVDHRPTRLLVSGYETEEQESVLKHFQSYGEVVDYITDSALPSVTLNYKTRKDAEMALIKGKHFQDRTLSITWCTTPTTNNQIKNATRDLLLSESEEDLLIDQGGGEAEEELGPEISEEALLQDDEEEDDEGEDRSWRR